jgi:glycosyltransferase involved in cell wall biosynthesis
VTGASNDRLGHVEEPLPPGVRVVLDARPMQEPDRAPLTAAYLDGLLEAFDAKPLVGESFAFFLQSDLDDPTERFAALEVVGRRMLPPTRLLRSGAMTIDPFLLRGAALGATWRADRGGAAGAVYHAVGGGPLPLASGLPVVVTLLDLAPWQLPGAFQRSVAARFGQRLRGQLLRDAAAVIVGTEATARDARRLLHLRRDRVRVVPLAPRPAFERASGSRSEDGATDEGAEAETRRLRGDLGLGERYLVYAGRYDARQDLGTLLRSLAALAGGDRPTALAEGIAWPPRVLLVGATPDDRASFAKAGAREGIGESLVYAPALRGRVLAGIVREARGVIVPVLSEAAGLQAIEAIACGTPVVATSVGALPEIIGPAGLLVEPGDPDRLAVALATIWADDRVHDRIAGAARDRAITGRRTWADVGAGTVPSLMVTIVPSFMTWTNVWPMVSVTCSPFLS